MDFVLGIIYYKNNFTSLRGSIFMWKDAVLFLASLTGSAVVQQDIQNDKNMLYISFFNGIYIWFFIYRCQIWI